jgi:phosphoglucomutase/phosphomannomutase
VGFKYIAKVIRDLDDPSQFIFGTEQSYGFVKGTYCRDKDAAIAALLLAELCEHLKRQGRTLLDLLHDLWWEHGYHAERATPIVMTGVAGRARIGEIMRAFRAQFPSEIAGLRVVEVWDLLTDEVIDPRTGEAIRRLGWNWNEDVLVGRLAQDPRSSVSVRPSGTEPSLKVYTNVRWPLPEGATRDDLAKTADQAEKLAEAMERDVMRAMGVG